MNYQPSTFQFPRSKGKKTEGERLIIHFVDPLSFRIPNFEVKKEKRKSEEGGVRKGQVQCGKVFFDRRKDLSREERLL